MPPRRCPRSAAPCPFAARERWVYLLVSHCTPISGCSRPALAGARLTSHPPPDLPAARPEPFRDHAPRGRPRVRHRRRGERGDHRRVLGVPTRVGLRGNGSAASVVLERSVSGGSRTIRRRGRAASRAPGARADGDTSPAHAERHEQGARVLPPRQPPVRGAHGRAPATRRPSSEKNRAHERVYERPDTRFQPAPRDGAAFRRSVRRAAHSFAARLRALARQSRPAPLAGPQARRRRHRAAPQKTQARVARERPERPERPERRAPREARDGWRRRDGDVFGRARGGGDGDGGGARGRPRTSRRAGHRARRARARREPPRDQPGRDRRPYGGGRGGRGGWGGRGRPGRRTPTQPPRAGRFFGGRAADDSARGGRAPGGSGGRRRQPGSIRRLAWAGRERTPRGARPRRARADHDVARLGSSRGGARGFRSRRRERREAGPTRRDSAHLLRRARGRLRR